MIWFLRIAFSLIFIALVSVTTWASMKLTLWDTPRAVATHPWFIATLFDTYFAFLTFYAWVAYKECCWIRHIVWLIAILLLGNIAMSVYLLIELFRVPASASLEQVLLRRRKV